MGGLFSGVDFQLAVSGGLISATRFVTSGFRMGDFGEPVLQLLVSGGRFPGSLSQLDVFKQLILALSCSRCLREIGYGALLF
jgi:hypothetical protein